MIDPPLAAFPEPGEDALAGLWSSALQSLAARAAHDVNNALNGAVVNVEVVRVRARPGADAGAVASFAAAAADQLEGISARVAALLAFARAPRAPADVAAVARDASTLLSADPPAGARSAVTSAAPGAVRLAIVSALVAVLDRAPGKVESAGTDSAMEPVRLLRCTIQAEDRPTIEIAPRYDAALPAPVERALAAVGIDAAYRPESLTLAFPPAAAP